MCGLSERYLHHLAQKVKRRTASNGVERRPVRRSVRQLRVQHHVKPPVRLVMNTVLAVDQDAP